MSYVREESRRKFNFPQEWRIWIWKDSAISLDISLSPWSFLLSHMPLIPGIIDDFKMEMNGKLRSEQLRQDYYHTLSREEKKAEENK